MEFLKLRVKFPTDPTCIAGQINDWHHWTIICMINWRPNEGTKTSMAKSSAAVGCTGAEADLRRRAFT